MYAVVETGGKQYRVSPKSYVEVDLIKDDAGELLADGLEIELDKVLMLANEGKYTIGAPHVAGAKVIARVVHGLEKGEKIIVFKKRRRQGYKKTIGHRQQYTQLFIKEIAA